VIQVTQYTPPSHYANQVREKGRRFLARVPNPTSSQFKKHAYWRDIHDDLYKLYNGICSYCASWTPRTPDAGNNHTSVDHFIPKATLPSHAYEWSNYRLCRARLNSFKSNSLVVVDPFFIGPNWFVIDFTSFLLKPNPSAAVNLTAKLRIQKTIDCLHLNDNDYVQERLADL
jgi:hypothetical protein